MVDSRNHGLLSKQTTQMRVTTVALWPAQSHYHLLNWLVSPVRFCLDDYILILNKASSTARGYPTSVGALAAHIEQPRFPELLRRFLYDQLNPDAVVSADN